MELKLLGTLIRLLLMTSTVVTAAAIVLGSVNPEPRPRRLASRRVYQVLGADVTAAQGGRPLVLNIETGCLEPLALPPGVGLDKASVSPWEEDGRLQIVGLGWSRSGRGNLSRCTDFGLLRISLPEGEILGRLTLPEDALPQSQLCWIPDAPGGLIYAGDGTIYRVDFGSSCVIGVEHAADARPLPWPDSPHCRESATSDSGT